LEEKFFGPAGDPMSTRNYVYREL